jgi:hypothetical protein
MKDQREVSQQQQQENQLPPLGGATTGSSSSACGCIEPFGIVLALISVVVYTCLRLVFWYGPWWLAIVIPFLLTLVAVVCLFRAAKRYQNERGQSSSSSVGVIWMVLSWVFCAVAGVIAIVDVVVSYDNIDYDDYYDDDDYYDNYEYYQYELRRGIVTLVGMFIASICMLIYAEISRRKATGHLLTQSTNNVAVGDIEAPLNTNDEPSVGSTPPTVIAHEVRGSVLAQEAKERNNNKNNNDVTIELPAASYASSNYMPHNKDQYRSVVALALPRALVIGDPIHDASRIVEQQHGQRRAAIDP